MTTRFIMRAMVVALLFAAPARVLANVGRYLPDLPADYPNTRITAYGTVHQFDRDVIDIPKNINAGQIKFDYAKSLHQDYPPGTGKYASATLFGGFFMANGVSVKPGYQLSWVQTVTSSSTGGSAMTNWGLPASGAGEYPDAGPADPQYPFRTPDTFTGYTVGFEDSPTRPLVNPETWQAELGLVCIKTTPDTNGFREVRVISSFFWGFSTNPQAPLDINDVNEVPPTLYGVPTNSFINTLNSFYDGQGPPPGNVASSKFLFSSNSNCFIPEPGALWLLVIGGALLRRRIRAA